MTGSRGALTALHLLLVWAMTAALMPTFGFAVLASGWGGGLSVAIPVLAVGVPLMWGLLAMTALPVRTIVPMCGSLRQRLGWAALVFVLGTIGVLAGLGAYLQGIDLGSAGTRFALAGVPYALAAALFVPDWRVRLGTLAVLICGVGYGVFVGPALAEQRQEEAEIALYRQNPELLYLGDSPRGMEISRVRVGPNLFSVDYTPVQAGYNLGHVGFWVNHSITPALQCPAPVQKEVTCTVNTHGEMRTVTSFPGGSSITLVRRHGDVEITVTSESLEETGLRRLLTTLHPLSDAELDELMRGKKIAHAQ
ncbi:hypothetical protein ABZ926_14290 [Streptomyces litmocidini]|uniref:hypothetical protein n=1 Tax=Streptomyces litmocidini TaxID=67318 RepID=UPI0033CE93D3